jgi:hypothetical protein
MEITKNYIHIEWLNNATYKLSLVYTSFMTYQLCFVSRPVYRSVLQFI